MQLSATEFIFSHLLIASAINYFVGLACETNSTIRILNEKQCINMGGEWSKFNSNFDNI